jgi:2-haloalkanoic acid dehalogenase type II
MDGVRLSDFSVLSFDCYGTLIDWETGILEALEPWLQREGLELTADQILEAFGRQEALQEEGTPSMRYPQVLSNVHRRLAAEWRISSTNEDADAFAKSIRYWPAFPDSAGSLVYLKRHFRLAILSNVDRESFRWSNQKLGVEFDWVFTAEDIGSYKPSRRNFEYMLRQLARVGIGRRQILHTAQSIFHDHVPASKMGLATNWIDRRHAQEGWGATAPPTEEVSVTFHHTSLAQLVDRHSTEVSEH